jgi:hypothetical protein
MEMGVGVGGWAGVEVSLAVGVGVSVCVKGGGGVSVCMWVWEKVLNQCLQGFIYQFLGYKNPRMHSLGYILEFLRILIISYII